MPNEEASGQSFGDRLSVHGFLSQAYSSASDYQIRGIPTDGTTDYRTAALQFRYALTDNDALVIQLSHRRLAKSPLAALEPEVAFDWGFFQKRWVGASFRVGKVPIPKGLFNEVRDVGTILPFYQANKAFYTEGVETVDGITVSRAFETDGGWGVEANVFGGTVPIVIQVSLPSGTVVIDSDMEDTYGAQLWVLTPYHWLKVGAGTNRGKVYTDGEVSNEIEGNYASAQVSFDRWYLRGEANSTQLSTGKTTAWYGQAGVRLGGGFWINGELSQSHMDMDATPFTPPLDYYPTKDKALGISYAATPNVVLKLENHWFKGFDVDEFVSVAGEPVENNFLILSVSAAF
jgi:hypothetical protein